jgi:enoyl-CoA hydratase
VLRVEQPADGVTLLTLDRPEKRNALSIELRDAIADALDASDARCVVVTGAGSAFCAGMDVTQFGGDAEQRQRLLAANDRFFDALLGCPVPLVAAVNGPALGGGFALALLCDVRLATSSAASFGFPEIAQGIPPSLGCAQRALPPGVAHDLCLTGRVVDSREAIELGIVRRGEWRNVAEAVAALPPEGVRQAVAWARQGPWREQLDRERALLRQALLG